MWSFTKNDSSPMVQFDMLFIHDHCRDLRQTSSICGGMIVIFLVIIDSMPVFEFYILPSFFFSIFDSIFNNLINDN